ETPYAVQETARAVEPVGGPCDIRIERPHEHFVKPQRIRPVGTYDIVRIDDITPGFAHLFVVLAENHSLVEQLLERLLRWNDADIVQELVPEPGVQQVQDRMFRTTDVKVDR